MDQDADVRLLTTEETMEELGLKPQTIRFTSNFTLPLYHSVDESCKRIMTALRTKAKVKVSHLYY